MLLTSFCEDVLPEPNESFLTSRRGEGAPAGTFSSGNTMGRSSVLFLTGAATSTFPRVTRSRKTQAFTVPLVHLMVPAEEEALAVVNRVGKSDGCGVVIFCSLGIYRCTSS